MKNNTIADCKYNSVIISSLQNIWPVLLLLAIFCIAVMVRLDALPRWIEEPDRAFYGGEPLLPSVDGYYYLSLSRDLLEGKYAAVNEMRGVPDSPLRPIPPPLLSWLGYVVSKYTGLSLNWVAMLLPAMLGSLIVFPVYAYGKKFNGRFMGVSSALFAALAGSYVIRTRAGVYDTDCLIISLVLCMGLFFWNAATAETLTGRVGSFTAALLASTLLYFWWEQAPDIVFIISAGFCCIGLLFFYRPSFREGCVVYGLLCGLLLAIVYHCGIGFYTDIFEEVWRKLTYITKTGSSQYPNIAGSITEQQTYSFEKSVERTTVTVHILILSVSGLLGLLIKRKKDVLILSVFIVIGLLGVFSASRFLIFLSPVLALGLGFFLSEFWLSPKRSYRSLAILLFFLLAIVYHFSAINSIVTWPYNDKYETHALVQLKEKTPENAVVWSTWGKGYLINYWARRATISDGAIHSGRLSHYLYWPLAQRNPQFGANFIKFFSVRGVGGISDFRSRTGFNEKDAMKHIEKILSANPDHAQNLCRNMASLVGEYKDEGIMSWYSFFFPELERPVYLFFHKRMLSSTWWYWYGTWDIDSQEGAKTNYALFTDLLFGVDDRVTTVWLQSIDLQLGTFSGKQLAEVYDLNDGELIKRHFTDGKRIVYVNRKNKEAVLMDEELWDSLFNCLFVRSQKMKHYFEPMYTDGFTAKVLRVR